MRIETYKKREVHMILVTFTMVISLYVSKWHDAFVVLLLGKSSNDVFVGSATAHRGE